MVYWQGLLGRGKEKKRGKETKSFPKYRLGTGGGETSGRKGRIQDPYKSLKRKGEGSSFSLSPRKRKSEGGGGREAANEKIGGGEKGKEGNRTGSYPHSPMFPPKSKQKKEERTPKEGPT